MIIIGHKVGDKKIFLQGYSVFIQTDKAIYKPGNTVQFRVIVLSPQLKPAVTGGIDVSLRDGAGNLIRDWARVFTTRGVWAASIDVADKPVLGNWNITVDVNGQLFSKSFQVTEYVLPKFQVRISRHDQVRQRNLFIQCNTSPHIKLNRTIQPGRLLVLIL